eukprot:Pompholyxophrys_punicea_v1_NODE_511_length_1807_cov_7.989726.p1 type:complete len:133 gc:universal NODE_511_length_1807_cov_7.989726:1282-1680(+)
MNCRTGKNVEKPTRNLERSGARTFDSTSCNDFTCLVILAKILQSDNGTEFVKEVVTQLTSRFHIDHRCVSPYHPRANGAAEKTTRTLLKTLQGEIQAWPEVLPAVMLMLNSKIAALHGASPFSVMSLPYAGF